MKSCAVRVSTAVPSDCFLLLDRGEQSFSDREQERDQPLVGPYDLSELRYRGKIWPQSIIEGDDASGPQQPHPECQVLKVIVRIRIAEHHVVPAVGQPRQDVACPADYQPGLVGRETRLLEDLACEPVALGLDVDAGEHGARAHTAQQPDARTSASGADLDDRPGADRGREEAQRGSGRGRDRLHATEIGGVGARREQRLVERVELRPAIVNRDDSPLSWSVSRDTPTRSCASLALRRPAVEHQGGGVR